MMNSVNTVNLKITLKFVSNFRMLKQDKYIDGVNKILASTNEDFIPSLFERLDYGVTLEDKVRFRTEEKLNDGFHYALALNEKDEVIGFTEFKLKTSEDNMKTLNIGTSAVSKSFHGQGVAKMLYGFIDELAFKLKVGAVYKRTWALNTRQLRLYEKFGYSEVSREINGRGVGNDSITFCKLIEY